MTPRKNRTEIFEDVIYYCAIPIDSEKLYDKVTRYIQVKRKKFEIARSESWSQIPRNHRFMFVDSCSE